MEFRLWLFRSAAPRPFGSDSHGDTQRGKALVEGAACASCHGIHLQGQALFPRLAWQSAHYLGKQMKAYRDGQRLDDSGAMPGIVSTLSDADIAAIANYLQHYPDFPPTEQHRENPHEH